MSSAQGFCRSREGLAPPDIQLLFSPASYDLNTFGALEREPGATIAISIARPESRGSIMATSADPLARPVIKPNYLSAPGDLRVALAGLRHARRVFAALPRGVRHRAADVKTASRDEQVRLWWDDTPIDIFFAANRFHHDVARRCVTVPFGGRSIRVLCAEDLAVFKAMFDRSRDWVDIETMAASGAIDLDLAASRLLEELGDDPRVARLRNITPR